ncbi:hypothetical protein [Candidatus Harpocratesius sp.]
MGNSNNFEELWEDIPSYAFIALGRRGREQISLYQCFTPGCNETKLDMLHIVDAEEKSIQTNSDGSKVSSIAYKIKCDTCGSVFRLVFEQYLDPNPNKIDENNEAEEDNSLVLFENVYATDESGQNNYGQIGFVQSK